MLGNRRGNIFVEVELLIFDSFVGDIIVIGYYDVCSLDLDVVSLIS